MNNFKKQTVGWASENSFYPQTERTWSNAAGSQPIGFLGIPGINTDMYSAGISNDAAANIAANIYNAKGLIFSDQQAVINAFGTLKSLNDVALVASVFNGLYGVDMYQYVASFMNPLFGQDYMTSLDGVVAGLNRA